MKYFNFLFFLLFFFTACENSSPNQEGFDLGKYKLTNVPGSNQKKAVMQNDKGKVLEEGFVENGKKQGTWIIYHGDRDTPRNIANYINGVLNGPYFDFQPYGQVELMCNYYNGKLNGPFSRYKSIRKTEEGEYVDGKLNGVFKKYYEGKNVVQQELSYKDGVMDGPNIYYNDRGEVTMKYNYRDGEKIDGGIVKASATKQ